MQSVTKDNEIKPHVRRGNKLYCACHDQLVMDLATSIALSYAEAGTNPDRLFRWPPDRVDSR